MKKTWMAAGVGLVLLAAAGGWGAYSLGKREGMQVTGGPGAAPAARAAGSRESGEDATRRHMAAGLKAGDVDPANGQRILYYHDPMVPANRFDKPAKSPFMDMMMSPVYAGGDRDAGQVTVSPRVQQNLGVRTAEVTEGRLAPDLSAVGTIAFNERDQVIVQSRATGYVERLLVRATLDRVAKGQALAELYVPEWVAAQEEFLSVRRMHGSELAPLVDGARQRMRQAGMSEAQMALVEHSGQPQARFTLVAPIGGVVTELALREGMTVTAGATLLRINGLGTVWAHAEVPESQAALLRPGAKVQAQSPALSGATFEGRVQALLPEVNPTTRTVKARMELANARGALVPGMFVRMQFVDMGAGKVLLMPTEAVIQTGRRTVAIVAEADGRFRPVDIEIGTESGGQTEIRRGLQAGQRVVVSSQFLIDSEASLRGVEARLNVEPQPQPQPKPEAAATAPPPPGRGQGRERRPRRVDAVARPDPVLEVGADDDGVQAARARSAGRPEGG
nr:efflux RND transporter periplasmic adaptor subunit [Aquabacterium sp. J223]